MIIGIDPGLTGAVAVIGEDVEVHDIPVMARGKGQGRVKAQVNAAGLVELLDLSVDGGRADVYLERVASMPGQGVASMFSMGDTFGCIRGVCAALGYTVYLITPQEWKKAYKLGSDKEVIRAKAIELYPKAPLSRKKDHNRAEALLIARYGMGAA